MDSLIVLFGKLGVLSCVPAQTMAFVGVFIHTSVYLPLSQPCLFMPMHVCLKS